MEENTPINLATINSPKDVSNDLLHRTDNFKSSIVSVKAGAELKSHTSQTDAFILMIEGEGTFTLEEKAYALKSGDFFSFKANQVHSLKAVKDVRMLLVK